MASSFDMTARNGCGARRGFGALHFVEARSTDGCMTLDPRLEAPFVT